MKKSICTSLAVSVALVTAALTAGGASAAPAPADMSTKLAGRVVFLDPGHQGGGTAAQLNRPVDNGRGGTKACQTTGMTALGGMPEHTITWRVAQLVKTSLESLGAKVLLSRPDDTSWGGCITDRAAAANASGADVAISIHADGAPAADHGFHFIVPQLPIPNAIANQVQSSKGLAATKQVRDAYERAGFQPANYAGAVDGLQTRSDIAGPALTTVPDVFVEMGNGANAADAAQLTSAQGQLKHAMAITTGLVGYLLGVPSTGPGSPAVTAPEAGYTPDVAEPGMNGAGPAGDPSQTAPGGTVTPGLTQNTPGGAAPDDQNGSRASGGLLENLTTTAVHVLAPLLQVLGIDSTNAPAVLGMASDLATKLLSVLAQQ